MDATILEVLAIILGNGALIALVGYGFQYQQHKSEKDFEARKDAREYYKTIYGHIAILADLAKGYGASLSTGEAEVSEFNECRFCIMPSEKILTNYSESYLKFEAYYLKTKKEGHEIFISRKLQKL